MTVLVLIIAALVIVLALVADKSLAAKLRGEWMAEVSDVQRRIDALEASVKAKLP